MEAKHSWQAAEQERGCNAPYQVLQPARGAELNAFKGGKQKALFKADPGRLGKHAPETMATSN